MGRSRELSELDSQFARVADGGRGLVFVTGRPGFGRSRLLRELSQRWTRDGAALVISASCHNRNMASLAALDEVMDRTVEHLRALPTPLLRRVCPPELTVLRHPFPVLSPLLKATYTQEELAPPPAVGQARRRTATALRRLLTRMASLKPLVLIFDDVQWSTPEMVELLLAALTPRVPRRVLVVISARQMGEEPTTYGEVGELGQLARAPHLSLELGALPAQEGHDLVVSLLEDLPDPELAADLLLADGTNSPWELELKASWYRRRQLSSAPPRSTPPMEEILANSLAQLTPASLALLRLMAVARRPLPEGLLVCALGLPAGEAQVAARHLEELSFLQPEHHGGEWRWSCGHARVRQTLLRRAEPDALQTANLALATQMDERGWGTAEDRLPFLLEAALRDRAYPCARAAAKEALERLSYDRALQYYQTLTDLGVREDDREWLHQSRAEALALLGRRDEAARAYRRAIDICTEPDLRSELQIRLAENLLAAGHSADATATLELIAQGVGFYYPRQRLLALLLLAWRRIAVWRSGDTFTSRSSERCDPHKLRQIDIYRAIFMGLQWVDDLQSLIFQSAWYLQALRVGEPIRAAHALMGEAYVSVMLKGPSSGQRPFRLLEQSREIAAELDLPWLRAISDETESLVVLVTGRWAQALRLADRALPGLERVGQQAEMLTGGGQLDRCRIVVLSAACRLGHHHRMRQVLLPWLQEWAQRGAHRYRSLMQVPIAWYWMAEDQPARGHEEIDIAFESCREAAGSLLSLFNFGAHIELELYEGVSLRSRADHYVNRLKQFTFELRAPQPFHRIIEWDFINRVALSATIEGYRPTAMRALVRFNCLRLQRNPTAWARGIAARDRAMLAALDGDIPAALSQLEAAQMLFESEEIALYAHGCRVRRGDLMGASGQALREEGLRGLLKLGIVNPQRLVRTYFPWPGDHPQARGPLRHRSDR